MRQLNPFVVKEIVLKFPLTGFPSKVKSMCPQEIFATKRKDKEQGRIIILTSSNMQINQDRLRLIAKISKLELGLSLNSR